MCFPLKGLWVLVTQDVRGRKELLLASLKTLLRLPSFFLQMRWIQGNRPLFRTVGTAVNVSFLWLAVPALVLPASLLPGVTPAVTLDGGVEGTSNVAS